MRTAALEHLRQLAHQKVGVLATVTELAFANKKLELASALTKELEQAGYVITYKDGAHGNWVKVTGVDAETGETVVVAQAFSESEPDALKQAMYGALKEL